VRFDLRRLFLPVIKISLFKHTGIGKGKKEEKKRNLNIGRKKEGKISNIGPLSGLTTARPYGTRARSPIYYPLSRMREMEPCKTFNRS
jgi:hypothetical protein